STANRPRSAKSDQRLDSACEAARLKARPLEIVGASVTSASQVEAGDLGVAQERRARALDLVRPTGEHVAAVRELQRPLGVLLDHQYCYARLVDLGNLLEDHVDEERRQSGRRLVEHQEP